LAQSSLTGQQIAQASARLFEGARDPRVAEAICNQQDAIQNLADLYRQRSDLSGSPQDRVGAPADAADLSRRAATAEQAQAAADAPLQGACPGAAEGGSLSGPARILLGRRRVYAGHALVCE
jgi:hypothetical protein